MNISPLSLGLWLRCYRLVLWVLVPRALRREFGEPMTEVFTDVLRTAWVRNGWRGVVRAWCVEISQLVVVAVQERRHGTREYGWKPARRWSPREIVADVRHGLRAVGRQPLFAVLIVVLVALGVGLNTTVMSFARVTVAGELPYVDAGTLAVVRGTMEAPERVTQSGITVRELFEYRDHAARGLEDVAVFSLWGNVTASMMDTAERLRATYVTPSYFSLLRVPAALGTVFTPSADGDAEPTVVLSHGYWQRRFGGRDDAIGQTLRLVGRDHVIVGVMPEGFRDVTRPLNAADIWVPLEWGRAVFGPDMFETWYAAQFLGLTRLAPGETFEVVEEEMRAHAEAMGADIRRSVPRSVRLIPLREYYLGSLDTPLRALFVGALFVLAVCGLNVGALVLLRFRNRGRELAVRAALGASRGRLAQHVVAEIGLLVVVGYGGGIALAAATTRWLEAGYATRLPMFASPSLDPVVLVGSLVMLLLIGVGAAALPTWRTMRARSGRMTILPLPSRPGPPVKTGASVIAFEAGMATVLLVGAGLMGRSLASAVRIETGYNAANLLTVQFDLTGSAHGSSGDQVRFAREVVETVAAHPAVSAVGLLGPNMLGSAAWYFTMTPAGQDVADPRNQVPVQWLSVAPGTLDAMGVSILQGRDVSWGDRATAPEVAVVDRRVADRFWPGEDPVGKQVHVNGSRIRRATVIGVVENASNQSRFTTRLVAGDAYFPYAQVPTRHGGLLVRGSEEQRADLVDAVRSVVRSIDRDVPVFNVATMSERLRLEESALRLAVMLTSVYAAIAVLLSLVGTAGIVAYAVRLRRAELAIRCALGAGTASVVRHVLRTTLIPMGWGTGLGIAAALGLSRSLEVLLVGVRGSDPQTYAAVAAFLLVAGTLAGVVPARRAARVRPMEILKAE